MACTCVLEVNAWLTRRNGTPVLSQECRGCSVEDWVLLVKLAEKILAGGVYLHAVETSRHGRGAPSRYALLTFELRYGPVTRLIATATGGSVWRGEIDYMAVARGCLGDAAVVSGDWEWVVALLHDAALYMLLGDDAICSGLTYEVVPTEGWMRAHCS